MTIAEPTLTRSPLGKIEARFLARVGSQATFSIADARRVLGQRPGDPTRQFLQKLRTKGWIGQICRGIYAVLPLSACERRTIELHEFMVGMQLATPAAIAYGSALVHHGMTDRVPQLVYVATNHRVRRPAKQVLGIDYRLISLNPPKFFGVTTELLDGQPFQVTDREKTILDGLDLPRYVGGVDEIALALSGSWHELDEPRLHDYAFRMGNIAVAKRLGYLMETLHLGNPEALRKWVKLASWYSLLDPTLPRYGTYHRRWGLFINLGVED
jgi:predicted transcriptional regulator of viral defense system